MFVLLLFLSVVYLFSSLSYLYSDLHLLLPCGQRRGKHPLRLRPMRSIAPWRYTILPQVMSPTSLTTFPTRRPLKSSSRRNPAIQMRCPRTCVTRNSTMRPSGKCYLHHCSIRSEKRQAYHSHEESLLPAQSFFTHARTERPVHELSSCQKRKSSREMENERIKILRERQKRANPL